MRHKKSSFEQAASVAPMQQTQKEIKMSEFAISADLANTPPIRETIFDYLRTAIMEKRLRPGQKMVEREIAEQFQISRTPVREALQKLETEGFLERKKSKSYLVRSVAFEEMQEAYMLRHVLEPLMVRACAQKITSSESEILKHILSETMQAHHNGDYNKVSEKLLEFDRTLMDIANLPKLKEILLSLLEDLRRFRCSNLTHRARRVEAIQEHTQILEAIMAGNEDLAAQYTCEHIQNSQNQLQNALKKQSKKST